MTQPVPARPAHRRARLPTRIGCSLLLVGPLTLGLGEAVVRLGDVAPRVVVVRDGGDGGSVRLRALRGRTVWEQLERGRPGAPTRQNLDCDAAAARRVHIYGDSIFFGAGLSASESLGPALQAGLAAWRPHERWCVQNFAQPAATLWPQRAFADEHLAQSRPDVVILELSYGSARVPVVLGGVVYYLDQQATDAEGYPTWAWGLTGAWHHSLFDASRFWAWSTFVVNPGCADCAASWDDAIAGDLGAMVAQARAVGAEVLIATTPPLSRSIEDLIAQPVDWYDPVIAWAAEEGIAVVRVEHLLRGQRVEDVRRNTCCHYNATGTAVIAEGLAEVVHARLGPG